MSSYRASGDQAGALFCACFPVTPHEGEPVSIIAHARALFRSDSGNFSMTSIIIGAVLAIGLVAGLAVGLSKLIPWGQDMVAKQDLAAIKVAETVAKAKEGRFLRDTELKAGDWMEVHERSLAEADNTGSCYVAAVASQTGKVFFTTDAMTEKKQLQASTSLGDCLEPAEQAQFRTRIAAMPGVELDSSAGSGEDVTTLVYRCDAAGTVRLPIRDITGETTFSWSDGVKATATPGSYAVAAGDTYSRPVPAGETLTVDVKGTYGSFNSYDEANYWALEGTDCLRGVTSWGEGTGVKSAQRAFFGAYSLEQVPRQVPSTIKDMSYMFAQTAEMAGIDISGWNTGNVEDMSFMFEYSRSNPDISQWDTSSVLNMNSMFSEAAFSGDISGWNTGSVTNMGGMFYRKYDSTFNSDISRWNTSEVTDMSFMFAGAEKFNADISGWNTGKVKNMDSMFKLAKAFNQDISGWDVSKVERHYSFRDSSALTAENSPFG